MILLNMKVTHRMFGQGNIIAHENEYITIRFQQGEKKFIYPNAFDGFLIAEDSKLADKIKLELETVRTVEAQEKERLAKQMQKRQDNRSGYHKSANTKVDARSNVAFKCNYCDGGRSSEQIGFNGVCSDDIIRNNIEIEKRTWCSSDDCLCPKYLRGEITRKKLVSSLNKGDLVCYESQMLRDWRAFAGMVQTGERKGQPMKLNQVQENSLCVLTTRDPNTNERDRYIFGVFLIDEAYEGDNREVGYVTTRSKYRIKLSPQEARKMLFWNFHANSNQPEATVWSSGLHRYYDDEQAMQILQDIKKVKKGTKDEKLANEFLAHFAKINNIDMDNVAENNGALLRA